MARLEGRIALVTGASRGIGRAAAVALAKTGCDVVVNYRHDAEAAGETSRQVAETGQKALTVQADVCDSGEVSRMFEIVGREWGEVDVLVNNAGQAHPRAIEDLTVEDFDLEIAVNLRSAFLVTQAFLPAMRRKRWGRLIYISSVAAQVGGVVGPHYAASKAGLSGLVHAYASRLATEGITANAIAPALIDTDMIRQNARARADLIPVGRFGQSDEVADLIVTIVGNGYITGQTINVNGGWYFT
jgi:3-oxoacyl-[acyl-carrier protein] reductase